MALDYKKLSDDRLQMLLEIRSLIKKECPDYFAHGCLQTTTVDALKQIFESGKLIQRGRDAFRDELIRLGYTHQQLVDLTEKTTKKTEENINVQIENHRRIS